MARQIFLWMKKYGYWQTWAVVSLIMVLFSTAASVVLMLLLMGEVSHRGLLISIILPVFFILTVQRAYMQMVYDLEQTRMRLDELVRTDELTGAANRRSMIEKLGEEFARSKRTGVGFLVFFFDMDGFKNINDHYGHPAGDKVLIEVVRAIKSRIREVDTLARMGGDEFCLLTPGASLHEAPEMASRIGSIVRNLEFNFKGKAVHPFSSIGWAAWSADMESPEELLHLADQALYSEKYRKGESRITLATEAESVFLPDPKMG